MPNLDITWYNQQYRRAVISWHAGFLKKRGHIHIFAERKKIAFSNKSLSLSIAILSVFKHVLQPNFLLIYLVLSFLTQGWGLLIFGYLLLCTFHLLQCSPVTYEAAVYMDASINLFNEQKKTDWHVLKLKAIWPNYELYEPGHRVGFFLKFPLNPAGLSQVTSIIGDQATLLPAHCPWWSAWDRAKNHWPDKWFVTLFCEHQFSSIMLEPSVKWHPDTCQTCHVTYLTRAKHELMFCQLTHS